MFPFRTYAGAIALAAAASLAHAQPALRDASRSFTVELDAPPAVAFPLFGPVREAEWAPGWKPKFLHPATPAQAPGAVFLTEGEHGTLTWLVSRYDEAAGEVAYEVLAPGYALTRITIRVAPAPTAGHSIATVGYRRAALSPSANAYVEAFERHFESQGPHWQAAINSALAAKARP
jgi:hypothetical protein